MPDEFRRLTFSQAEIKQAITTFPESSVKKLPKGDVTSVAPLRKGNAYFFELTFFDYSSPKESRIEINEGEALSMIIHYCGGGDVPLPRASRKEPRVVDQMLCVDIFMGEAALPQL
jgi:hypothetical protein